MKKHAASLTGNALLFGLLCMLAATAAYTQTQPPDAAAVADAPRVGFIDMDAIAEKAVFAQELKKAVEAEYNAKRAHYQAKQAEYASLLDEIKRLEAGPAEEAKDAKYKAAFQLKSQLDEEQYTIEKFLKDSDKKKAPALERISAAAKLVAQTEGFDIILSRELLVFGRPSVNLSDKVIARLNTEKEASAASPAPAPGKKAPATPAN